MKSIANLRRGGLLTGFLVAAAAFSPAAHAQLTTFAEFGRNASTPTSGFQFTNSGSSSSLGVLSGSIPVRFQYDTTNGYDGTGYSTIAATLTVSGVVSGPASVTGSTITQNFSSFSLALTANKPVAGATNLLTANFSNATGGTLFLTGSSQGGSASFGGTDSNAKGTVDYSSDFLDFSNSSTQTILSSQFALSLTSVQNQIPGGGIGLTVNANGYVDSFGASGTGNFSSNPVPPGKTPTAVPEPSALMLLGLPLAGMLVKRIKSAKTA